VQKEKVCSPKDRFYQEKMTYSIVYESVRLRESIFHTIGQSSADLESQSKASEYALRKRLHELERALNELEWQKKQVFSIESFVFFSH
jgi:tektin-2